MKPWAVQLIAATLAVAWLQHPLLADTLVLANGDTLTGKVVAQSDGGVVFDHAQLGQFNIPADNIQAVRLDAPATDAADSNPADKPEPSPQAGKDIEAPAGVAVPAPKPDPAAEAQAKKEQAAKAAAEQAPPSALDLFLDEWDTKLTLGFTGTSGNTDRQNYHAKVDTLYETDDTRWAINVGWFYASSNNNRTQNEIQTRITRDWLQKGRSWFFFIRGEHEYDQFRNWENRASGFGGAGYTFIDEDKIDLKGRMGFGGTYEFGQVNEFTPEALFGGTVAKWKINDKQTLSGEFTYYPSLEEESDFRIQAKVEWQHKLDLASGMSLKIGVQNEYDSRTPGDNDNNDMKYYGALVIDF